MNIRDIQQQELQPKLDRKQDLHERFRAVIVAADGSRLLGSPWFNQNRRLVWFQRAETGISGNIGWAYCASLEPDLGLGVWIQWNPWIALYEVLGDDATQRSDSSPTTSYTSISNTDLLRGGRFQLWVETEMIVPLACYPNASGLAVNIVAGDYIYAGERKTYAGSSSYDISGSQPAGPNEHRLVGLYLDSANALQTVNGTAVATGVTAPEPSWPDDAYRLCVVELDDTQTDIDFADDIDDRKVNWADQKSDEAANIIRIRVFN